MSDVQPLSDFEKLNFANMLNLLKGSPAMSCEYRNWRGETSTRRFIMREFWYGSTQWHPKPCLLLKAFDLDKGEERDFCITDFDTSTLRIDLGGDRASR